MLKIGLAQTHNHFELEKNLASIQRAIETFSTQNADLILFPECALTGYHTGLLKADAGAIVRPTRQVQAWAKESKLTVALPTPWPNEKGHFHNAVLLISPAGEITEIFRKIGLQRGEEKIFVPSDSHRRYFDLKGHRIGVIICVETSHEPWLYVKQTDKPELIFWPGFYGAAEENVSQDWSSSASASDQKVRDNLLHHWQAPLLQINCATSPEAHFWPGKLFGGSAVYDRDGSTLFSARRSSEEFTLLDWSGEKITALRSLTA